MTSEVCVMNRRAIVLAADSAATVTTYASGKPEERYFKGSSKIFEMSAFKAIGLMIFDNADLQQVPWEIVVKAYRTYLDNRQCGKLTDYASDFFKFIENHRGLFPEDLLSELFVKAADQAIIGVFNLCKADHRVMAAAGNPPALQSVWTAVLDEQHLAAIGSSFSSGFSRGDADDALSENIKQLETEALADLQYYAPGVSYPESKLAQLGTYLLFNFPSKYLPSTGLVIAGYSDDEYFPSYQEYDCAGFIWKKLHYSKKEGHKIAPDSSGHIKAFATTAMVNTFRLGFGPEVYENVRSSLKDVLGDFSSKLIALCGGAAPSNVQSLIADAIEEHTDKWAGDVVRFNSRPLNNVIGSLPVADMANLAETMITLESLKEKVTQPSESVSGPVDVAVLTKSEGFIWIKRKFFFEAGLNPRYFVRQRQSFREGR